MITKQPGSQMHPQFIYGTAWKEAETERLTEQAIRLGFRAIDTANQRKHYFEAGVGNAIASSIANKVVRREDLFIQTKFTFQGGQDLRLPYDPNAPVAKQVEQSFASSFGHLGVGWIDSYVLHGPSQRPGLGSQDWEAWRAMEAIHDSGVAEFLGVSNVTLEQLELLCEKARVRPAFVQNRCYASRGWDRSVREYCRDNGIQYQGFSLLTANRDVLVRPEMSAIAKKYGCTVTQLVFRFAMDVGMIPLTGTTNSDHMRIDLEVLKSRVGPDDVAAIELMSIRD